MEYKKILGREISEKTAVEIERIVAYIEHPVVFQELPENNPHGFGCSNYFAEPERIVYSTINLPQRAFEANLLHELYHLCQFHDDFPTTKTKPQPSLSPNDYNFLYGLGSVPASLVLDLDVCDRIKHFGLSSQYFFETRYHQAMSYHFDELTHKDAQVSMTLRIAGIILQNNSWQARNVIQHYQGKNKYITMKANRLASKIKKCDHNTPIGCFKCLTIIYDYLAMWDWQEIAFQNTIISDSQTANTLLEHFCHKDF